MQTSGAVEDRAGLPLELWLGLAGRATRSDRRMLLACADVLPTLPRTWQAWRDRALSWSQIRAIVSATRPVPLADRARLDTAIADDVDDYRGAEPDELTWRVDQLTACLDPDPDDPDGPAEVPVGNSAVLQPRLDGHGGKLWANLDAVGFATLDQALAARTGRPAGLSPDPTTHTDPEARAGNRDRIAATRGQALVDMARDDLAGTHLPDTPGHDRTDPEAGSHPTRRVAARPLILATTTLDTLLGLSHGPARLLTTVTGGQLHVTADTLRRLVDDGGAALRLVVTTPTGRAVGVGRRARLAPGWLREASLALHPECVEPNCRRSARGCDLDHTRPWNKGGTTDLDNLAPLCRSAHTRKRGHGWALDPAAPDGTRTWTHHPTGLTARIPPATRHLTPNTGPDPPPTR